MENFLQLELKKAAELMMQENLFRQIDILNFDCSTLPDSKTDGKNLPVELIENFFTKLHEFDESEGKINEFPCIYVFELCNKSDNERVKNKFLEQKNKEFDRTLPALKNRCYA